jgi:hypothetical protein
MVCESTFGPTARDFSLASRAPHKSYFKDLTFVFSFESSRLHRPCFARAACQVIQQVGVFGHQIQVMWVPKQDQCFTDAGTNDCSNTGGLSLPYGPPPW